MAASLHGPPRPPVRPPFRRARRAAGRGGRAERRRAQARPGRRQRRLHPARADRAVRAGCEFLERLRDRGHECSAFPAITTFRCTTCCAASCRRWRATGGSSTRLCARSSSCRASRCWASTPRVADLQGRPDQRRAGRVHPRDLRAHDRDSRAHSRHASSLVRDAGRRGGRARRSAGRSWRWTRSRRPGRHAARRA